MSPDDLDKSFQYLEFDCHLKVFFAGDPIDNKPEPLYVKSIWGPPLESIPQEIDNLHVPLLSTNEKSFQTSKRCVKPSSISTKASGLVETTPIVDYSQ